MSPEILRKTSNLLLLAGALYALTGAFTLKTRQLIWERAEGRCESPGCDKEYPEWKMECSHINHDKSRPNYDDPNNGHLFCLECHRDDHINNEGHNGLSKSRNRWAIRKIGERMLIEQGSLTPEP